MIKKLLLVSVVSLVLSGCSSNETKIKEFMKCGMAANQIGQNRAANEIGDAMGKFAQKNNFNGNARSAMFLGQEVRDDLDLYNKSAERKYFTFLKIHNSSTCQNMHDQGKSSAPWLYYLLYFFV